jgi:hypothetical protein
MEESAIVDPDIMLGWLHKTISIVLAYQNESMTPVTINS